jgi:hypothetical protein
MSNINKEDRIIVSGLTSKEPKPMRMEDGTVWLKNIVSEFLNSIEAGISSEIIFVTNGRRKDKEIPLAEVRMKSREVATRLRKNLQARKSGSRLWKSIYH